MKKIMEQDEEDYDNFEYLTTTVFLLLHLPKKLAMVDAEVILLLMVFINQLVFLGCYCRFTRLREGQGK
jgi:hypothetical protein